MIDFNSNTKEIALMKELLVTSSAGKIKAAEKEWIKNELLTIVHTVSPSMTASGGKSLMQMMQSSSHPRAYPAWKGNKKKKTNQQWKKCWYKAAAAAP